MDLFTLIGKFILDTKKGEQDLDNVTNKAQKSESKIGGAMKKIALAVGGAFAVQKIIQFGKTLIETTANLQAMRSQFDQVFKSDRAEALARINEQAKELGVHGDRLTGTWNKFGAQFKGAGMEGAQAMDAVALATRLSADASAFFDKSLEETSSAMASFAKGNFEAGDALGVFTNAKQMDVKSNEKYGKSWADLSEQERQWLLLDTVEKTYELNGASGQASREMNNWSNVMGNLKATWDAFLEKIGTPVLAIAVDVVKRMSSGIEFLQEKMGSMDFGAILKGSEMFQKIKDVFDQFVTLVKDQIPFVKGLLDQIWTGLQTVWNDVGRPIFDQIIQMVQDWMGVIADNMPQIQRIVQMVFTFIGSVWESTLKPAFLAILDLVKVLWEYFKLAFPIILDLVEIAFSRIMDSWNNVLKPVFDDIIKGINRLKEIFEAIFPVVKEIFRIFVSALKGDWEAILKPVFDKIGAIVKWVKDQFDAFMGPIVGNVRGWFTSIQTSIAEKIDGAKATVDSAIAGIVSFFDRFTGAKNTAISIFEGIRSGIVDKVTWARDKISEIIETIKGYFDFSWSLPSIGLPRLPKITITGSFSLTPPSVPRISWNALGGIFAKPTVLPTMNGLQGFGEAGKEAILPLKQIVPLMSEAFKKLDVGKGNEMGAMLRYLQIIASKDPNLYIDGKKMMRATYDHFDDHMARNTINDIIATGGAI